MDRIQQGDHAHALLDALDQSQDIIQDCAACNRLGRGQHLKAQSQGELTAVYHPHAFAELLGGQARRVEDAAQAVRRMEGEDVRSPGVEEPFVAHLEAAHRGRGGGRRNGQAWQALVKLLARKSISILITFIAKIQDGRYDLDAVHQAQFFRNVGCAVSDQ